MAFDRTKAVDYAKKHWNIPCDDNVIWLSNEAILIAAARKKHKAPEADGWQPMFVQGPGDEPERAVFRKAGEADKLIAPWEGLADCAHYLSKCLTAGGASVSELGVRALVEKLQGFGNTKTLCEKVSRAAGQRVINSGIMKPGDMIGYFNIDPQGDYNGAHRYTHSTMYVGKLDAAGEGGVACHTVARFPPLSWVKDTWWLKDGAYEYTFIHFSDDDPKPDLTKAEALAGWWKVQYGGSTEYYLISKGGSAKWTAQEPKKKDSSIVSRGSAYWFMATDGTITFTWRKTGTVEVWSENRGAYTTKVNGTPGTVTKMF